MNFTFYSPEEFIKYILDNLRKEGYINPHWKPQTYSCPFCGMDFKIIGKLEELVQDTFYILSIADLHELIDPNLKLNPTKSYQMGHEFWSQVEDRLIKDVYSAYHLDFETFDYDPIEYLISKDLHEKAQALKKRLRK